MVGTCEFHSDSLSLLVDHSPAQSSSLRTSTNPRSRHSCRSAWDRYHCNKGDPCASKIIFWWKSLIKPRSFTVFVEGRFSVARTWRLILCLLEIVCTSVVQVQPFLTICPSWSFLPVRFQLHCLIESSRHIDLILLHGTVRIGEGAGDGQTCWRDLDYNGRRFMISLWWFKVLYFLTGTLAALLPISNV